MIKTRLISLLSHAKKYIYQQVLWQWLGLVCRIVSVLTAAGLVEAAFGGSLTGQRMAVAALVVAAAAGVRFLTEQKASEASYLASADVKRLLREKIYTKLLRLGASYRESVPTSEVVQLSSEGVEQLETYFGRYLPQLFYSLLAPLTLFAVLSFVNLRASLVLLVCVPLIPVSIVVVQKIAKRLLSKYWGLYAELGDSFLENLQGLTTAKIYRADARKAAEMDEESEHFRKVTMKVLTMQLNSTSVMDIVAYGGAAAGMGIALAEFFLGNVNLAGALAIILLASEFFIPLRILGSYFHIAMNGLAASDRIFALLDLPEPPEKTEVLEDGPVDITLEKVSFAYEEGRDVLTGVDLDFPTGSFTALAGVSGCGKSTVAGILMGRHKGYRGSIRIQGKELSEISEESLMRHITLVTHESYLFKGTVRDNLKMGNPEADDEELREALAKASILDFFDGAEGLDTRIDERGSNLSGGQRQRLALARALLHDTPVYIFDEAASNVDAESEALIMKTIHEMAEMKTVVLISHRLANAAGADRIYMMQGGKVCESGSHAELLAKGGLYSELYRSQKALEAYAGTVETTGEGESRSATFSLAGSKEAAHAAGQAEAAASRAASHSDNRRKALVGKADREDGHAAAAASGDRRSGLAIMGRLIGLVKPLLPVMILAIFLGVTGYSCAISLTILASGGLLGGTETAGSLARVLIVLAVARGLLHYGEQYCNHFIAFRLLAIIRHKVFAALRRLCPAKLEGKERGNLISVITSDIELLEVFYAHTISPIAIAVVISLVMAGFIGSRNLPAGLLAAAGDIIVGAVIPLWNGKRSAADGMAFREGMGSLSSFVLDALRGLDETIQYGNGGDQLEELTVRSGRLARRQRRLNRYERGQRALTGLVIEIFSYGMLFIMLAAFAGGRALGTDLVLVSVAMMGSFGPVVALSSLSNNLNQTLASGERVLRLLEEEPVVTDVTGRPETAFEGAEASDVTFGYAGETVLRGFSLQIPKGKVVGIHGPSGCGKSTLLKLLMRFWDADAGQVLISGKDIGEINTADLRGMEAYVTQETYIWHDTLAANIAVGREGATREEIEQAAEKAGLKEFLADLPAGLDTKAGELGDTLSGGERQRIGLARAFLHDGPFLLLDEPTSNLDVLNEGMILKALAESAGEKTVVLVSHRKSTLKAADVIVEM